MFGFIETFYFVPVNARVKQYVGEFVGTFFLVLVGTGSIVLNDFTQGRITHLGISIAFGGIVTLMIYAFGKWSGAHINPAVTLGFWVSNKMDTKYVKPYLVFQLLGACLASLVLMISFPENETLGATLPVAGIPQSALLEFGLTAFLMLVILVFSSTLKSLKPYAAFAIGATVGLEAYFAGPYTGASMNPARSIAPALFSGQYEGLWLYIFATTLGAILVAYAWKIFRKSS